MSDARAIKALEHLQPALDEMESAIVSEVGRLISDNALTPEIALQKWYQLNALQTLPRKVIRGVNRARQSK